VSARRLACRNGCISGDSLIETVDGPLAIAALVGKPMPVLTRLLNGQVGFRLMTKIACTTTGIGVVRVTFDNGRSVVVDRSHIFFGPDKVERPVGAIAAGEVLDSSFHFPSGYVFRRTDGATETSAGGVRVAAIEDAGTADVFGGIVNETHCYFLTAGVLCKE
jgi:hypothetical protein